MARLPSEYQEVEWIQSDGECWLNTNFMPNGQTSVYGKIMFLPEGITTNRWTWGCGTDWNRNVFEFSIDVTSYYGFAWDYGANTGGGRLGGTPKAEHIYSVEQVKNTLKIIDETAGTTSHNTSYFGEQTFNTNMNMLIFSSSRGNDSPTSPKSIMRLWYLKIYDNGTLVRDMIPCYRKSDNEIGMYDIANDVFYTNQGSGTFSKGNDVYTFPDFRAVKNFYIGELNIPEEYQEVDYIESTGTQYINTGISTSGNREKEFIQELEICLTGTSSSDYQVFSGNDCCGSFDVGKNSTKNYDIEFLNQWHKVKSQRVIAVNRSAWVDDVLVSTGTTTYMYSAPVCVFCSYFGGPFRFSKARIKYYKLSIEGTLVRNMIPCYRKSDGVIGMYDTVGSTFYANAGSGTFIKGNDVNTRIEVVEISRYVGTSRMILWSTIDYDITVDSFIDNYFYSDDTRATARQHISNYK